MKFPETFSANVPPMDRVRFTSVLSLTDLKIPARSEVFIDHSHRYARLESFEDETASVYDLKLGVQYNFIKKQGDIVCESGPIVDGPLQTIEKWLYSYQHNFKSLGKFDHVQYLGKGFCVSHDAFSCFMPIISTKINKIDW